MMSKKTKAMEQQLTQLAQENDALRAQLAAAGVEIENVKSELAKTVGERDRFRNELNGAQLDLSNAKRRLDDFRLRQEAIVNALTEAHNTRERILKEANANADRIDAEAKQRRTDILNKAQAALESAKKEAAQLIADAKRDAAGIRTEGCTAGYGPRPWRGNGVDRRRKSRCRNDDGRSTGCG